MDWIPYTHSYTGMIYDIICKHPRPIETLLFLKVSSAANTSLAVKDY